MGKNYEVEVISRVVIVVMDADSETDAFDAAMDEVRTSTFRAGMLDSRTREIADADLERARRHADEIAEPA